MVVEQFGLIIRRAPLTSRVPDLAVFEKSTIVEKDGYIHSAPQLVVEVLSPSERAESIEEKLADYASLGVPEAWVVGAAGKDRGSAVPGRGPPAPRAASGGRNPHAEAFPHREGGHRRDLAGVTHMATVPNVKTVTYEEWLRMPEVSDATEEVVNGEIRIMPAPNVVSHCRDRGQPAPPDLVAG